MSALDALLGTISKDGVELELGSGLNFTGAVTVVRNAATGKIDIAVTGGGSGGHTIKDESTALTQRAVMRFAGAGVAAADSGGETVVTVPSLTAGNGITNTAGTLSVNPAGTTLSVGAGGVGLRAGSAAGQELFWDGAAWQLVGRKSFALGDASVTVQPASSGAQGIWPAATNTTAIRTITVGTTGMAALPNAGAGFILNLFFFRASYAHNIVVANGGGGGGTLFTLTASTADAYACSLYYDGTNWSLAGFEPITVTAA